MDLDNLEIVLTQTEALTKRIFGAGLKNLWSIGSQHYEIDTGEDFQSLLTIGSTMHSVLATSSSYKDPNGVRLLLFFPIDNPTTDDELDRIYCEFGFKKEASRCTLDIEGVIGDLTTRNTLVTHKQSFRPIKKTYKENKITLDLDLEDHLCLEKALLTLKSLLAFIREQIKIAT